MPPSVLAIGIPSSSPLIPEQHRGYITKALKDMEADMEASPYDFEVFWFTPDMKFEFLTQKLQQKKWDLVLIGGGIRTMSNLTVFSESIFNMVHRELPGARFAFNETIETTQEACRRVLGS